MEAGRYSAPVSRPLRVLVGLVLTIMGAALLAFLAVGLYALLNGAEKQLMVGLAVIGTIGIVLCLIGIDSSLVDVVTTAVSSRPGCCALPASSLSRRP
jgi:hypothetical protein